MVTWWIAASIALQVTDATLPARPEYGHYVVDGSNVLDAYSEHVIDSIAARRAAEGRPLYLVTVDSVVSDASDATSLEAFATSTYDRWEIGGSAAPARGTLVLIAGKRSAIVFGRGWGRVHEADARRFAQDVFNPAMASDNPADGMVAGVRALSNVIAARSAWLGRGIAAIPVVAILLAWLSYGRIRSRSARRDSERAAVFERVALTINARQQAVLRAAGQQDRPALRPSDPPS